MFEKAEPPKPVEPREIAVTVEKMSYAPDAVQAKANEKLKFVFTRVSESRCGEEIVFPDYGIKKTPPIEPTSRGRDYNQSCRNDWVRVRDGYDEGLDHRSVVLSSLVFRKR